MRRSLLFKMIAPPTAFLLAILLPFGCGGGGDGGDAANGSTPVVSEPSATSISTNGAQLLGNVNPNGLATNVWFEWSIDPVFSTFASTASRSIGSGLGVVPVSTQITGLTENTKYYFRVCASNAKGESESDILSLTTSPPGAAPAVTTLAATSVGATNATLNGNVTANGLATNTWFEWGTDAGLAIFASTAPQPIGSGAAATLVTFDLTGLTPGTTYYFRVAASNGSATSRGAILSVFPEVPALQWSNEYGGIGYDAGFAVRQTEDGGYIVAGGYDADEVPTTDAFLMKVDPSGTRLWLKTWGSLMYSDLASDAGEDVGGGYIVTGYVSLAAANGDLNLVKFDSDGSVLWSKTYGGLAFDWGYGVRQTSDEGYVIAGSTDSFGAGSSDVYLIRVDLDGNTLWSRTFGGPDRDRGESVLQTTDGGYVVTGSTNSFGAGGSDVYLIRVDPDGNILWSKTFGGIGEDAGRDLLQSSDGGYVIVGSTDSFGAGGGDVYLIKTDSNGTAIWSKTYGGADNDGGLGIEETSDGGYIIVGSTDSFGAGGGDVYLIKTDSNGNILWSKTYGGADYDSGHAVQQTADGGYIVAGVSYSFGTGNGDIYLIKTDADGNTQ